MITDYLANSKMILELRIPKIIQFKMMISCLRLVRKDLSNQFRKQSSRVISIKKINLTILFINIVFNNLVKRKMTKLVSIMMRTLQILIKMLLSKKR